MRITIRVNDPILALAGSLLPADLRTVAGLEGELRIAVPSTATSGNQACLWRRVVASRADRDG
jgi:hypothetical protein